MKVADISNYDYDQDIYNPDGWVQALIEAGVEGFIIGSQNMMKARWQLEHIRTAGSPVVATYAEPNVTTAIQLAEESGAKRVCIVIEPGGIRTLSELRAGIANVRAHLLKPTIYGNRSDILALIGDSLEFEDVPLWFASYGLNDGTKAPVTEVDFGGFTVWAHQYTSTAYIAGKNRDLNYVFEEDDMGMTPEEKARMDRLENLVGAWGYRDKAGTVLTGQKALQAMADDGVSLVLTAQNQNKAILDLASAATQAAITGDSDELEEVVNNLLEALNKSKEELS